MGITKNKQNNMLWISPDTLCYNSDMDKKRRFFVGFICIIFIFLAASIAFFYAQNQQKATDDDLLNTALSKVPGINSYSQHVETEDAVSGSIIKVVGDYDLDPKNQRFRSQCETSTFTAGEEHEFTITNISIRDEIYTLIESTDKFIESRMPEVNEWHHFQKDNIPERYKNIAINGPIMDNLRLFYENGKYIKLVEKHEEGRYSLALSDEAFTESGKQMLGTIVERIGKSGTIDVWINPETFYIEKMKFKNPPYVSTATITNINNVSSINPPVLK